MDAKEREVIEDVLSDIEDDIKTDGWVEMPARNIAPLARFARQQLNMTQKIDAFRKAIIEAGGVKLHIPVEHSVKVESLFMALFTTEPKEVE